MKNQLHVIADDLGYPADRQVGPNELPLLPDWLTLAEADLERDVRSRLRAETIMDEQADPWW